MLKLQRPARRPPRPDKRIRSGIAPFLDKGIGGQFRRQLAAVTRSFAWSETLAFVIS